MSGVQFHISFATDVKQFERLKFIVEQFHPEFKGMTPTKENFYKQQKAKEKIMNDALRSYYKEILGNVNQGNEHDGLPLIEGIYD